MKKVILWSLIIIILAGAGFLAWHIFSPYRKLQAIAAVPESSIFIIETENSYDLFNKLNKSSVWSVLQKHEIFSKAADGMEVIDTLVQANNDLAKFVGNRNLVICMNLVSKSQYDFLYIVDLRRVSKAIPVKDIFKSFISSKYEVKTNLYRDKTIYQIQKRNSDYLPVHITFYENLMVASFSQALIKKSLDQIEKSPVANNPKFKIIRDKLGNSGLFRLYINYSQIDDYLNTLLATTDPNLRQLSRSLCFTGLIFDIPDNKLIKCDGYTNYNDSVPSSFRAMVLSGTGKTNISEVLPLKTASSVVLGFSRFTGYFDNVLSNLKEVPKSYKEYEESIKQAEKFLKISVKDNLMSWIGDEAAMVQLAPMGLGKKNEFAVFLRAYDIEAARANLDIVARQIRKRTPVKFDQIDYNGYFINYLSMKGLFKLLLGKYFQKLDKPYYTIIGDYVVFSNHPQSLKVVIDGVVNAKLLNTKNDYNAFIDNFDRKSNIFVLLNTEQFLKNLQGTFNSYTWNKFEKNLEYIKCFPYLGFQLEEDGKMFKTKLFVSFTNEQHVEQDDDDIALIDTTEKTDSLGIESENVADTRVDEILKQVDQYVSEDPNVKEYKETYANGNLKVEFEMRDGFRHGDYREYYENGKLKVKGQYNRDHRHGTWKIYDEDENLLKKISY